MKMNLLLALALAAVRSVAAESPFHFTEVSDKSLGLWEGARPVFVYNHGVMSRTNVPADRARSSYMHPLYGLDCEVLTDDFPKDHYHHRGLFWAWPHVRIGDQHPMALAESVQYRVLPHQSGARTFAEMVFGVENTAIRLLEQKLGCPVGRSVVHENKPVKTQFPVVGEKIGKPQRFVPGDAKDNVTLPGNLDFARDESQNRIIHRVLGSNLTALGPCRAYQSWKGASITPNS
jgi:hypothetical protein